ncbi:DUF4232 domain-containing protein [Allobranchiibius sp. GilTou73]|uniref:DUF4232 domain-containing protein n=1 Tax=Allobranchiibius sp. GilTou73 TaxID=2904523 RepID=UPI001F3325F9|nr:DUF4232 domain-containing protein [Allobranchiibius sp. GilTou73]UIJ36427.1 DUF4232 domain-containing protein [Allobranchiibius sp. GilTou73]
MDGAAGSAYYTVRLRNDGHATCTLDGYPGVSLVGANGVQLGHSADRNPAGTSRTVTLAEGAATTFIVQVADAGNYSSDQCRPTAARGFRIYPPGSTQAIFLSRSGITGCAGATVHQLTVGPVGYNPS